MDEEARKKHCNLLMFDIPLQNSPNISNGQRIMIDYTTSLENSNIREKSTSFVNPSPSIRPLSHNDFVDETFKQTLSSQKKHIPRPPNAFILYRRAKQPEVTTELGHISNSEISRILANKWKNEPEVVKLDWQKQADRMKMEHAQANPGYVYCPKKSPFKKTSRKGNRNTKKTRQSLSPCAASNLVNSSSFINNGEIIDKVVNSSEGDLTFLSTSNNYHPSFFYQDPSTHLSSPSSTDSLTENDHQQSTITHNDELFLHSDSDMNTLDDFELYLLQNLHSQDVNNLSHMQIQQTTQYNILHHL
ncbi:10528_t:CDS:2 [Ambispora gerdemannii]|uniref:10528_t:CDS:1 n=1 Tax=Ambispora gerdemannii TaxID=144530 RepID=A0A9N9AU83_9GLOM|nr:10528_t:CDS:2 [Ambispora gerdemannii]